MDNQYHCPICGEVVSLKTGGPGGTNSFLFKRQRRKQKERLLYFCSNHKCICGRDSICVIQSPKHIQYLRLKCQEHDTYVSYDGTFLAHAPHEEATYATKQSLNYIRVPERDYVEDVFDYSTPSPEEIIGHNETVGVRPGAITNRRDDPKLEAEISREINKIRANNLNIYLERIKVIRKAVGRFSDIPHSPDPDASVDTDIPSVFDDGFWTK